MDPLGLMLYHESLAMPATPAKAPKLSEETSDRVRALSYLSHVTRYPSRRESLALWLLAATLCGLCLTLIGVALYAEFQYTPR